MLNFLHDPILITLSNVFTLVTDKKRRYHVTDDEQSLVLKSYEELNGDWEKMVEYMKDNVMRMFWRSIPCETLYGQSKFKNPL